MRAHQTTLSAEASVARTLCWMEEPGNHKSSRGEQVSGLARYDKRIEELVEAFSEQVERVGGQALDELAAVAKSLADRLEGVAEQARQKRESEKTGE